MVTVLDRVIEGEDRSLPSKVHLELRRLWEGAVLTMDGILRAAWGRTPDTTQSDVYVSLVVKVGGVGPGIAEAWELPYGCEVQGGVTIEAHCGEGILDAFVPRPASPA